MARNEVEVEGVASLVAALKVLEPQLLKKTLRTELRDGAKIFQKEVKARIPKRTRAMEKAVKVRALKRSRKRDAGVTVQIRRKDLPLRIQKTKGYPPASLEYGWTQKTKNGVFRHAARPYQRPAFAAKKDEVTTKTTTGIKKGMEEILNNRIKK